MNLIRRMKPEDWDAVRSIYQEGIASGHATFETHPPAWEDWDENHMPECRFVTTQDRQVVGWAALSPVSSRCVYAGVAEVSVYVSAAMRGRGVGKKLLQTLIHGSEGAGIWTLQAGIFPENLASIKLHKSCGFREVGYREHLGKLDGQWRNVILMEHRSKVAGI
jgi:phosphinothricin acetyltransferase